MRPLMRDPPLHAFILVSSLPGWQPLHGGLKAIHRTDHCLCYSRSWYARRGNHVSLICRLLDSSCQLAARRQENSHITVALAQRSKSRRRGLGCTWEARALPAKHGLQPSGVVGRECAEPADPADQRRHGSCPREAWG